MAFQSTVNITLGAGIAGEQFDDSPSRVSPWEVNSASAAYNIVGATAYTLNTADPGDGSGSGVAAAGGSGTFLGLLVNPKVYASFGTSSDTLAPTMTLPNFTIAELTTMGRWFVTLPAAASVGDSVYYDNTTGAIGTQPFSASGQMSQSTTTVTIQSSPAPVGGNIGVGSVITPASGEPVRVLALGSGTGGAGTYTVDVSQTVAANTAYTSTVTAPSGKTTIDGCYVHRYSPGAAGIGVITLNSKQ